MTSTELQSTATGTRRQIGAIITVAVVILIAGFAAARASRPERSEFAGTVLSSPRSKPDFTLTDTDGKSFNFQQETDGTLTLLFFGYTNCPDVCPVQMGVLHSALSQIEPEVRNSVRVVFVTTDPARDTPKVLDSFLGTFDESFIGLTGSPDEVKLAQQEAGVTVSSVTDVSEKGTKYLVGHATEVIAYSKDNQAHIVYPFGTREQDWIRDLPKIAKQWDGGTQ